MSETHAQAPAAPSPQALDRWLNIAMSALVIAIVGFAAFFGYTVWADYQKHQLTNAPMRVIAALKDQVRHSPNDVVLRVRLGEAFGSAGMYPEAVEQLNAALQIDPKHMGAYLDLGMVAMLTDENAKAEEYFKKVLEISETAGYTNVDSRRENAMYNLGRLKLDQQQYEEAAGYFKGALRIRKDASDTYVGLARALRGLDDVDGAIENAEIAIDFDPSFAEAHYLLGQLFQQKGDDVNASARFYEAARLEPDGDEAQEALAGYGPASDWVARATKSLEEGDVEAALTSALVARNLDPADVVPVRLHTKILIEREDVKGAIEVARQGLALKKNDPELTKQLTSLEQSHPAIALKVYQAELKKNPDDAELKAKVKQLKAKV